MQIETPRAAYLKQKYVEEGIYSFEQHGYIAAIAKIVYIFFETPPFQSKIPILNEDPFECSKDSQIYSLLREFMAFLLFSKK